MSKFKQQSIEIPYGDALNYYKKLHPDNPHLLLESCNATDKSNRLSMIGIDPVVEIKAKDAICEITLLQKRGSIFTDYLEKKFGVFIENKTSEKIIFNIPKTEFNRPENERFLRQNTGQILRSLLLHFQQNDQSFLGIYGALGYRFIYLYEDIEVVKPSNEADYHVFIFDNLLFFNHLNREAKLYCSRTSQSAAKKAVQTISKHLIETEELDFESPLIENIQFSPEDETFKAQVEQARNLCEQGELMELVLSRHISAKYSGDTLPLYESYRKTNPSPYLFHVNFGDEVLLGASPELMIRYENDRVVLRPISGSINRGVNAIEDHHLMMQLLNDTKEKSELDMLIDLGRNDLSKVCKPDISIDHYRTIEKYSHVMHTVAQVSGELQEGKIGLDALVASLNAGTLTGAPKVMAMNQIEKIELHERGFYGGCVGYMLFNGDVNTGIVIRSAHIKKDELNYCSGATLLYESSPEKELYETQFKAQAFLKSIEQFRK